MIPAIAIGVGIYAAYRLFVYGLVFYEISLVKGSNSPRSLEDLDAFYDEAGEGEDGSAEVLAAMYEVVKSAADWESITGDDGQGQTDDEKLEDYELPEFLMEDIPLGDEPLPGDMKGKVDGITSACDDALAKLSKALNNGHVRYPVRFVDWPRDLSNEDKFWGKGPDLISHSKLVSNTSKILVWKSACEGERDDVNGAIESILDCFALASTLEREPTVMSQLVRLVCLDLAVHALLRLANCGALLTHHLKVLLAAIDRVDSRRAWAGALAGERCLMDMSSLRSYEIESVRDDLRNMNRVTDFWFRWGSDDIAESITQDEEFIAQLEETHALGDEQGDDIDDLLDMTDFLEERRRDLEEQKAKPAELRNEESDEDYGPYEAFFDVDDSWAKSVFFSWPPLWEIPYKAAGLEQWDQWYGLRHVRRLMKVVESPPGVGSALEIASLASVPRLLAVTCHCMTWRMARGGYLNEVGLLSLAKAVLGIEMYRASENTLPLCLDDVVPAFVEETPIDPFTGGAVLFSRGDNGYEVFCMPGAPKDPGDAGGGEESRDRGYYRLRIMR